MFNRGSRLGHFEAKGFYVKFECRTSVGLRCFGSVSLASNDALDSHRISRITISVLLHDDLGRLHAANLIGIGRDTRALRATRSKLQHKPRTDAL